MICDEETTSPSAVDMIAARIPTPISAASQVGNNSMKSMGSDAFGVAPSWSSASPSTPRASNPARPSMPRVIPKVNASLMNDLC